MHQRGPSFSDVPSMVALSSGSYFPQEQGGHQRCHWDAHDMGLPFGQGLPITCQTCS